MSSLLILSGYSKNIDSQTAHPKITENPLKVELLLKIGPDKENEDFSDFSLICRFILTAKSNIF